jgi:hypothetical protein
MVILVSVNGTHLITLLDSGSTHNFIDNTAASRAGVMLAGWSDLRVAVTNGEKLVSSGCYRDMAMPVHKEHFQINCYDLPLGSFDLVLGVQWLESLGPIPWDFWWGTLAFVCNGHRVLWTAATSGSTPPPPPSLLATKGEIMEELLLEFTPLFQEPSGLPPHRIGPTTSTSFPGQHRMRCGRIATHTHKRPSSNGSARPWCIALSSALALSPSRHMYSLSRNLMTHGASVWITGHSMSTR